MQSILVNQCLTARFCLRSTPGVAGSHGVHVDPQDTLPEGLRQVLLDRLDDLNKGFMIGDPHHTGFVSLYDFRQACDDGTVTASGTPFVLPRAACLLLTAARVADALAGPPPRSCLPRGGVSSSVRYSTVSVCDEEITPSPSPSTLFLRYFAVAVREREPWV